jgi:hypothetical protein
MPNPGYCAVQIQRSTHIRLRERASRSGMTLTAFTEKIIYEKLEELDKTKPLKDMFSNAHQISH